MKPERGKVRAWPTHDGGTIPYIEGERGPRICTMSDRGDSFANARLIAAAWNACVEINPDNPIAAAEAMPEVMRAARDTLNAYNLDGTPINNLRARQALSRLRAAFLSATERK